MDDSDVLGLSPSTCYIWSLLMRDGKALMVMIKSKAALFVAAIFLPFCAFAERVPVRDGHGPIVRYDQKDIVRPVKWDADTQLLVSNRAYRNGTVGLGQFDLNDHAKRFDCKLIKKVEGADTLFVYLDRPRESRGNDWSLFVQYPDNYKCSPTRQAIEIVLDDAIKDVKKWEDYASSGEAKENARKFQLEQENKLNPKVEFGGYVATKKDIFGSVLLACYTGSLDRDGMLYVSKEEQENRYKALLGLYEGEPSSIKRITNAYNFARRNLSDRYPLDTMGQYRAGVCDQMVMKGKL
ncbi:hypothetical protein [Pseudomonas sp. B3G-3]|nr:hypothetical protein [Pseudomonas sp. B3G-3]